MAIIQYQISIRRAPSLVGETKSKWVISVATNRRGTFVSSGDLPSKAEGIRIARTLFRINREPDVSLKGLAQWTEERP